MNLIDTKNKRLRSYQQPTQKTKQPVSNYFSVSTPSKLNCLKEVLLLKKRLETITSPAQIAKPDRNTWATKVLEISNRIQTIQSISNGPQTVGEYYQQIQETK